MIEPRTLKGFRDFLPAEAKKRQYVINILKKVFEEYGFEPLETPVLEYEEILAGKYGEEGDKLMYRFEDLGRRKVAMRYDQTVPLARVVAQYENQIVFPFKRYQIQPVWRADNTQRGRFREFLQCDIDTVGTDSPLSDAEIITTVDKSLTTLGFKKFKIILSSRNLLFNKIKEAKIDENLSIAVIRIIDKIKKIGWQQFDKELLKLGIPDSKISHLNALLSMTQPTEDIYLNQVWNTCTQLGASHVTWYPYLARGLDYYTGIIFEAEIEEYSGGSVGGGGRYDNLIGMFVNKSIPAVGFAFGFDRLIEAMDELKLFPQDLITTQVLVTIFSKELKNKSLAICNELRNNNIKTEIYLGEIKEKNPLEKQLKYADQKGITNVIILGPEEAKKNLITVKNLKTREQKQIRLKDILLSLREAPR